MSLSDSFLKTFHSVIEDRFSTKFDLSDQRSLDASGMFKEITFGFDFSMADISQRVYYFMDKKFATSLFSAMISEIDNPQMDNDLTSKIINLLNTKILDKLNNDLKMQCVIKNGSLIKETNQEFVNEKNNLSVAYLNSQKGSVFIGFVSKASVYKEEKKSEADYAKELEYSKKSSGGLLQKQIIHKKDESSLRSAVQLMEIKKQVLVSLSEIKELKGDPDFLLRKAKTVTDLTRLWFDISREED